MDFLIPGESLAGSDTVLLELNYYCSLETTILELITLIYVILFSIFVGEDLELNFEMKIPKEAQQHETILYSNQRMHGFGNSSPPWHSTTPANMIGSTSVPSAIKRTTYTTRHIHTSTGRDTASNSWGLSLNERLHGVRNAGNQTGFVSLCPSDSMVIFIFFKTYASFFL